VTSGMTDSDLVERSLADAVVFAVIFDRHHSELSLRAPAGRARAAGDVAAETFVIAFAHQAAWRADGGSARLWLYGIAHNLLRNYARRERRPLLAYARYASARRLKKRVVPSRRLSPAGTKDCAERPRFSRRG
jgi:DNA-directed RNA polymerase specialized sigma24 family protein